MRLSPLRIVILVAAIFTAIAVGLAVVVWYVGSGIGGELQGAGEVTRVARPSEVRAAHARDATWSPSETGVRSSSSESRDKSILFGDLHVHTTLSSDAYLFSLPIIQGEGVHPPADACDFARFCSELDFFSLNDHAELIGPRQWQQTKDSIRQCNEVASDPEEPDLVAFLGWEWTDMATEKADEHYAHKNVILLGTEDDEVPTRPIGARSTVIDKAITGMGIIGGAIIALPDFPDVQPYLDFNRFRIDVSSVPHCPEGIPVRDLPPDCYEVAQTPEVLFDKLDDWGYPSIVIPHGTSWGIHSPPNASLATQLAGRRHDPARQRLFEVFSGHGSSERFRDWQHVAQDAKGEPVCPEPTDDFTSCCWQAGELIRARCDEVSDAICEERVALAKQLFLAAGPDPRRFSVVPDATPEDWLDCGTPREGFMEAYLFRPKMSAQYGLALGDFTNPEQPKRFRYGLIASSDNHKARAGSGYKEFARKAMSDAWGPRDDVAGAFSSEMERGAEPVPHDAVPVGKLFEPERGASFYYTGGLVAVHAQSRARESVWKGLVEREVYGTSGERILLWFDLLNARESAEPVPMGSEASVTGAPRFRVRAAGAFEQLPGCPAHTEQALGPERLRRLCLDECYHPSDRRKRITRIEVVRIRPQIRPDEAVNSLIEDPWRVLDCQDDRNGCEVEFEDPDFADAGRETVYYVRAIQEPSLAVNADPLRCERGIEGQCVKTRPCYASGPKFDPEDDCLAPAESRAWASPIFVSADDDEPSDPLTTTSRRIR